MNAHPMPKVNLSKSVKSYLIEYIQNAFHEGLTKLPPENVVAQNLGISRVTLRRALGELERDGVVIRIQGRGTFINPEAVSIQANFIPGEEFKKLIGACGYQASVQIIDLKKCLPSEADRRILGLEAGEEIYSIEKLYFANGHPAIVSVDRIPVNAIDICPQPDYMEQNSIFDLLRDYGGIIIERDKIAIESISYQKACTCAASGARLECDSALLLRGINYDRTNRPVLVDTELYDTNYIRFNLLRVKNVY